jgi:quercetin dioxygenase-like cupin family protein
MRNLFMIALVAALLIATAMGSFVQATAPNGVQSTVFAVGQFSEIDAKTLSSSWQARINTKGVSDLHILENKIAPGGSFGWHSHPGPSLVIVKTGALTVYLAADPTCTGRVVTAGSGFVDNGNDVHLVRNEGTIETVVYVASLVPHGAMRRIDEPASSHCGF